MTLRWGVGQNQFPGALTHRYWHVKVASPDGYCFHMERGNGRDEGVRGPPGTTRGGVIVSLPARTKAGWCSGVARGSWCAVSVRLVRRPQVLLRASTLPAPRRGDSF